jgi:hypothetical protein
MGRSTVGGSSPSVGTGGATSTSISTVNASTAAARLTFVTASGLSPLTEVEYFVQEPDPRAGTPGGLYRRERFLLDRQQAVEGSVAQTGSAEESEAVLLAPEVTGFEVEYYDPQSQISGSLGLQGSLTGDEGWETSWDAAAKGYLPQAVRITLTLGSWPAPTVSSGQAESTGATAVRRVSFVVSLPLAGAETSGTSAASGTQAGSSAQSGSGG